MKIMSEIYRDEVRQRAKKILGSSPGTWFASDTLALARDVLDLLERVEVTGLDLERKELIGRLFRERAARVAAEARAEAAESERAEWKTKTGHANRMKRRAEARVDQLTLLVDNFGLSREAELEAQVAELKEALDAAIRLAGVPVAPKEPDALG